MIVRAIVFLAWALSCLLIYGILLFLSAYGDCFGVQTCLENARRGVTAVTIIVPAVWLAGAIFHDLSLEPLMFSKTLIANREAVE